MSARTFARLNALVGLVGVVMVIVSQNINPVPLQDQPTAAHLAAFGHSSHWQIIIAAWLQAVGTVLSVVFAIALVHLAHAAQRFSGWLTLFGGLLLAVTSLVEAVFFFSATTGTQPTMNLISLDLIHAIHRMYYIVAVPALFFPLGAVLLSSRTLPRAFGYAAIGLAALFAALGIADLFWQLPIVDDLVRSLQVVWWLLAPVALLMRAGKFSAKVTRPAPDQTLA
jgi:hypothetical protein